MGSLSKTVPVEFGGRWFWAYDVSFGILLLEAIHVAVQMPPEQRPARADAVLEGLRTTSEWAPASPGSQTLSERICSMTDIPARLSIVTLGTREMGVLRSFYRALGWPELADGDDTWTGFHLGGVLLALFPMPDLTAEAAPGSASPAGWAGVTLACTVDTRDEVDAVFAAAVTAGATPVAEATDRPWGGRSAFIADPEGNRWEITWGPGATFDAHGALLSWG